MTFLWFKSITLSWLGTDVFDLTSVSEAGELHCLEPCPRSESKFLSLPAFSIPLGPDSASTLTLFNVVVLPFPPTPHAKCGSQAEEHRRIAT